MPKLPPKRILLPAIAVLLILLVVGVMFWPSGNSGNANQIKLMIQNVGWDTNGDVRINVLLTNTPSGIGVVFTSTSRSLSPDIWAEYPSGRTTQEIHLQNVESMPIVPRAFFGRNPGTSATSRVYLDLGFSATNTVMFENAPSQFRLTVPVTHTSTNLIARGIRAINDRFPSLLPQTVVEKSKYQEVRIYSDWITPTGVVSATSPK